ncbi:hypothetical protein LY76DRAFT_509928, partial [Colletotrichum caudatum]
WCFGYWVLAVFVRLVPVDSSAALGSLYSAQATLRGWSRAQVGENGPMEGGWVDVWFGGLIRARGRRRDRETAREWRGKIEKSRLGYAGREKLCMVCGVKMREREKRKRCPVQ